MELRDVSLLDLSTARDGEIDALSQLVDVAEVDRLIFDLTALIEAGLVDVREPLFGPARYGVVPAPDEGQLRMRVDCA